MRGTILFSSICALALQAAASGAAPPDVGPGLDLLRSGRFEEARLAFERITRAEPAAPEGPFFEAFHLWWRLIDRPDDTVLRLAMEERLAEAARRARGLLDGPEAQARQRGLVFRGVSLLLDAQSKAARGVHFGAASLVRQGHRALSEALAANPQAGDALFAMGAYNYYADRLPLLVKGLRFFLMIPGGDARKGIAQLEKAGDTSSMFGTEALMLLAHIYSGGYEEDYPRALAYVEKAASNSQGSPLISLARADLLFELGRLSESSDQASAALQRVRGGPGYATELERALAYRAAACALKRYDPIDALDSVEDALNRYRPGTPEEVKRWLGLLADATRETGRPERLEHWIERLEVPEAAAAAPRRRAALAAADTTAAARAEALHLLAHGGRDEAERRLRALIESHPGDLRLRYHLGRLLQQKGLFDLARPHLQAAADGPRAAPTADLAGWAMVRLGWDLERQGRRSEAIAFYRRAAEMKQFTFQPAALDRLARPDPVPPEG